MFEIKSIRNIFIKHLVHSKNTHYLLRLKLCTLNERLKDTSFSFISSLITFLHNYFTAF